MKITNNYISHQKHIGKISISAIVKVVKHVEHLADLLGEKADMDDLEAVLAPLEKIMQELDTGRTCFNCGTVLYKSDLPTYDFVCAV